MIHLFRIEKIHRSLTRKVPLLPRFGFVIDIADRQISFRQVPFTETIINLIERGPSLQNLNNIVKEQIREVTFPFQKNPTKTVDVSATTISRQSKKAKS